MKKNLNDDSFGFHPIAILKVFSSTKHFDDKNIKKIIRELTFNHAKIQTRKSGDEVGNILQLIKKTQNVPGEIIETGTYFGGLTILMAKYLELLDNDKKIFTLDSFEGMPKPKSDKFLDTEGFLKVNYKFVKNKFEKYSLDNRIVIVKGFIEETLKTLADKTFSFAIIDTNAYDSLKFALEFIYPRLSKNGIVAIDDYHKPNDSTKSLGTRLAVDEFCRENNLKLISIPFAHIIKN